MKEKRLTKEDIEEATTNAIFRILGIIFIVVIILSVIYAFGMAIYIEGKTTGETQGFQNAQDKIAENFDKYGSAQIITSKGEYINIERVHYCYESIFASNSNLGKLEIRK